jgi:hypothetical protein
VPANQLVNVAAGQTCCRHFDVTAIGYVQWENCGKLGCLETALLLPCRYCIAIMVDTEGSEIHTGELQAPIKTEVSS